MADQPSKHDLIHEMIQSAKSREDAHAVRRLLVSQISQLIEFVEKEDNGVIVTDQAVDWLVGFLAKYYPERDWTEDRFWIYQTVDTFLMLIYDANAAMIYSHTRDLIVESAIRRQTH